MTPDSRFVALVWRRRILRIFQMGEERRCQDRRAGPYYSAGFVPVRRIASAPLRFDRTYRACLKTNWEVLLTPA